MSKTKETVATEAPKLQPLTSLAEIQKLCAQQKRVEFNLDGRPCVLEVRRLTPAEDARIAEIIDSVIPPVIKGRTPEEDRLDTVNADYQKRKADAAVKARAQALYWSVPAIAGDKPGLSNLDDIARHVQSMLNETILALLWQASRDSGVEKAELVNFT